jgi:protein phosphatase
MTEYNFPIDSAAISDRGLSEKRPHNEDSFLILEKNGLFAVADGVGGAQAGDVASQMAMEIIGEAFKNLEPTMDAEEMMKIAIEKANSAIYQMSRDLTQLSTMATTIVALHLSGNIATIGHVGDSRLYRLDGRGRLFPETFDHSVVAEEVRAGRMTVAQAANHPSKNIISRALGAYKDVEVELKTIMFEPKTTFLLCSDGITRHIEDFEIRDLLLSMNDSESICQRMKEICYERGAEDNLTAVIVRVSTHSESINKTPNETFTREREEVTVASARPPLVDTGVITTTQDFNDEIQTQKLEMPEQLEPKEEEQPFTEDEVLVEKEENLTEFPQEILVEDEFEENIIDKEIEKDIAELEQPIFTDLPEDNEFVTPKKEVSLIGSIVSSIGIFLIGAILGAGAFWVFSQTSIQPVQAPPLQQPEVVEQNDFETARRNVDESPTLYIQNNRTKAETGEDYFLLGRAYFLVEDFAEAQKAFEEAKKRLGEIDEENRATIENDLETYSAVFSSEFSKTAWREYLKRKSLEDNSEIPEPNSNNQN